jgi:murein DD-endopeptidase MepM/ murein hydrolase activator NlpD
VVAGQPVEPDTLIGAVGRTGCASGNHLHLAVRHQGNLVDPARLIPTGERSESSE